MKKIAEGKVIHLTGLSVESNSAIIIKGRGFTEDQGVRKDIKEIFKSYDGQEIEIWVKEKEKKCPTCKGEGCIPTAKHDIYDVDWMTCPDCKDKP